MSKSAVVYWSGTGNTGAMARAVLEGARSAGNEAELFTASEFTGANPDDYDGIAFGCPAMGAEVLEETEFQPMFDQVKPRLAGKKVALFGSYGWGGGVWMDQWKDDCVQAGASLAADPVLCNGEPDDSVLAQCRSLGVSL